jgi:hypothetical protein
MVLEPVNYSGRLHGLGISFRWQIFISLPTLCALGLSFYLSCSKAAIVDVFLALWMRGSVPSVVIAK